MLLAAAALSFLAIRISVLSRIIAYFSIFSIVAIPEFLTFIENKKKRVVIELLIILLYVAYFVTISICRPEWNSVIPYRFFWQ